VPTRRALALVKPVGHHSRTPGGLGGRLAPADAASFQAASIAQAVLAEDVPEDVRSNFERARKLHLHGVLDYEFFTAAFDYALLVLEGALRARFLTYYDDGVPLLLREPHIANGRDVCPECFVQIKARRAAGSDMLALARRSQTGL
jgi:hypothetical protein